MIRATHELHERRKSRNVGVALALPVGLSVALENARQLGDNLDSPVQLSLFLGADVSLDEARQLELQIAALPEVASTVLVSSDDDVSCLARLADGCFLIGNFRRIGTRRCRRS